MQYSDIYIHTHHTHTHHTHTPTPTHPHPYTHTLTLTLTQPYPILTHTNLSPNLPSITLPLDSLPCPTQPYHSQPPSISLLTSTNPPSAITVTLQLPISNSTATHPTITLPSTICYSLYCCSTLHIETLTNNRK
ncbi:CPA_1a_G0006430.mRNA.1.CDS.1 [Saccharomyces cerevisiae]|nr:CPA_1a_G0006430.mRNA.1.CDS.1 [Saccharomyces cerevisiae]CAI7173379.1 CPA_1a_G0006430.mRNA.1.CDS.1 [Saccharomyces cerevisiae]